VGDKNVGNESITAGTKNVFQLGRKIM